MRMELRKFIQNLVRRIKSLFPYMWTFKLLFFPFRNNPYKILKTSLDLIGSERAVLKNVFRSIPLAPIINSLWDIVLFGISYMTVFKKKGLCGKLNFQIPKILTCKMMKINIHKWKFMLNYKIYYKFTETTL